MLENKVSNLEKQGIKVNSYVKKMAKEMDESILELRSAGQNDLASHLIKAIKIDRTSFNYSPTKKEAKKWKFKLQP